MKYLVYCLSFIFLIQVLKGQNSEKNEAPLNTKETEILFDLTLTQEERSLMQSSLKDQLSAYQSLHSFHIANSVPPAYTFFPGIFMSENNFDTSNLTLYQREDIKRPDNLEELAFHSVANLAELIRSRQITSLELTKFFLDQLKKWGDTLACVITLTEELALEQAQRADEELSKGIYRGPLHGIPYGAKDLLAVPAYPTTWGAEPYKKQTLNEKATVIQKLEDAGAVLVAKLTLGALAWGDVWYGGKTKNPWNLDQGSSGSSAGSASATAAGLVPFAIGSETLGSIISPSHRCGLTGLRPTYGRVSRHGAMVLSWSMDKLGPICRSALDCAIVLDAIKGTDGKDATVSNQPFLFDEKDNISTLRVGYFKELFNQANERTLANGKEAENPTLANNSKSLKVFEEMGIELVPVDLPSDLPVRAMDIILSAEAAAAFDELTRSNRDSLLVRQIENAWPNVFRAARFIPAVEFIQAQRYRYMLMQKMDSIFEEVDVIISPTYGSTQLLTTNLTGHPAIVVPDGRDEEGNHTSFTILGGLFQEAKVLLLAHLYQKNTPFDEEHPPLFLPQEGR